MTILISLLTGLVGLLVIALGVRTWWRGRVVERDALRRRRGRRTVGAGATVSALGPIAVTATAGLSGDDLALWLLLDAVWAGVVTLGSAVLLLGMALGGERIAQAVGRVAVRVPAPRMITGRSRATSSLPREREALIELDRSLGRRLLGYSSVDRAAEHPVMNDLDDPRTKAAVEAMLRCDELREEVPPNGWRDLRATPYAEAVAAFRDALAEAEAHSSRVNAGNVSPAERAVIDAAGQRLAYLREHATTPAERRQVYDRLVADLDRLDRPAPQQRSHPWLDADQRADRSTEG